MPARRWSSRRSVSCSGGRADAGAVRTGSGRTLVEGRVAVEPDGPAAVRAAEAGAELDDGALLLARTVSAEGRSRAHLGGRSVPVGLLSDLGSDLVAVHGQSDQQRLLQPARQRDALDRYAGEAVEELLAGYRADYARLRAVEAEIAAITSLARERAQEADLLRYGLAEIDAVTPEAGEDVALVAEASRLGHAEELSGAAATAHAHLMSDGALADAAPDAVGLVGLARRALEPVRDHDAELAGLADRLAEASYLLADVAADLASYAGGVDADPARLAAIEDRRAALSALTRKYGATVAEVLAWAETASVRLAELDADGTRGGELTAEAAALTASLTARARPAHERPDQGGQAVRQGRHRRAVGPGHARRRGVGGADDRHRARTARVRRGRAPARPAHRRSVAAHRARRVRG